MATALANFYGKRERKVPPKFVVISRADAKKELHVLVTRLDSLIKHLEHLHQPTIVALANQHILQAELLQALQKLRLPLVATKIEPSRRKPHRGRPRKVLANSVARVLARNYRTLTKQRPTVPTDWETERPYGPYYRLVQHVFTILRIKANPEAMARNAVKRQRRKRH